jgi:hypothetical protein
MKCLGLKTIPLTLVCILATLSYGQRPVPPTVVGTWHLVRIEYSGPDGKPSEAPQPTGMLLYTNDGHAAVQLMYPQTSLQNEFVHDGYEATFGTYDLDQGRHGNSGEARRNKRDAALRLARQSAHDNPAHPNRPALVGHLGTLLSCTVRSRFSYFSVGPLNNCEATWPDGSSSLNC